ncbi:hypothetical protein [Rufibacter quisquiliarum]|uniref:Uncharacterized protein n=1 Tax=Rufibacter quisquiliarum TaxID=1549639 RepID=A0A839GN72_9BACT|nr:hypothetical protein [Rufibacter quisquiliarum]MBA9076396.1 hypothetical protein [Rufibacter quisquiliarum]
MFNRYGTNVEGLSLEKKETFGCFVTEKFVLCILEILAFWVFASVCCLKDSAGDVLLVTNTGDGPKLFYWEILPYGFYEKEGTKVKPGF